MSTSIQLVTARFRLTATIHGREQGPPVVLIHGFPASGALWEQVVPELSRHFTVIVPDLPGVGASRLEGTAVTIEELADGIAALLKTAHIDQAVVAGHSMGGYIALALAERHPGLIKGLSLVHSTAMPDDEEKKANRRRAIALIEQGAKEAFIRQSVGTLFAPEFKARHPELVEKQIAAGITVPDSTLTAFYNAMMQRPSRIHILQKAAFPVQWLIGSSDTVIPKEKGMQQSSIARISFVSLYRHSGHMSMLEEPALLAKDLEHFAVYCNKRTAKEFVR